MSIEVVVAFLVGLIVGFVIRWLFPDRKVVQKNITAGGDVVGGTRDDVQKR